MALPPSLDQRSWRFRPDGGTNDTPGNWLAAEQTSIVWQPGFVFRVRLALQEYTGNLGTISLNPQLKVRKNGGSWTSVNGASSVVRSAAASRTDGGNCGQHKLTTGTSGTHGGTAGFDSADGVSGPSSVMTNNHYETEYSVTIQAADVARGDLLEFRAENGGDITTWSQIPSLTVSVPEGAARLGLAPEGRVAGLSMARGSSAALMSSVAQLRAEGRMHALASMGLLAEGILRGKSAAQGSAEMATGSLARAAGIAMARGFGAVAGDAQGALRGVAAAAGVSSVAMDARAALAALAALRGELAMDLRASNTSSVAQAIIRLIEVIDAAQVGEVADAARIGDVLDIAAIGGQTHAAGVAVEIPDAGDVGEVLDVRPLV